VTALGLILYGASVYLIAVSGLPDFTLTIPEAGNYILYSIILGLFSAIVGVVLQYFMNKKLAEQRRQEIIEVL
jgi:phosphotransferase system  glucose/maltose/N-acetylglucosamine-specific IIC component